MWSGQEDRQFIGRVWRHPQPKPVLVYRPLAMEVNEASLSNISFSKEEMHDAFIAPVELSPLIRKSAHGARDRCYIHIELTFLAHQAMLRRKQSETMTMLPVTPPVLRRVPPPAVARVAVVAAVAVLARRSSPGTRSRRRNRPCRPVRRSRKARRGQQVAIRRRAGPPLR